MLSEVARQGSDADRIQALGRIGSLARRIRSSMDDIVWAVDPRKDHLADLVVRVRQLATSSLEPHGVAVEVAMQPKGSGPLDLPPDARRQMFLFCTEAVTNIVRHAAASSVSIAFRVQGGRLTVRVSDDGAGFDPASVEAGRGLTTLRTRIESMGGALAVAAAPGHGVTLAADVPLAFRRRWR
jgi:signal transduction histidine kinase